MSQRDAVIVEAVRTPVGVGKPGKGALSGIHPGDLGAHVRASNPILPVPAFPAAAVLPSGNPGNHYIFARFTAPGTTHGFVQPTRVTDAGRAGGANVAAQRRGRAVRAPEALGSITKTGRLGGRNMAPSHRSDLHALSPRAAWLPTSTT